MDKSAVKLAAGGQPARDFLCPAPISAKEPKVDGSRFSVSALW
jgi:hypothetical protein